jgi:methionyl-tRNA formyltransferase
MQFVFFGTPEFAAIILEKLIAVGFVPAAVVCNPDKPVGRKQIITPPPTKILARTFGIPTLQPDELDSNFIAQISGLRPDFFVIAAYAKIISKEILDIPRLGAIGVHPSLLPKYRGSTPIQSVILSGEKETGVTLYFLDEKMDHGPILESRKWKIENRSTYEVLLKELAELAGNLLVEILPKFAAEEIKPEPQNEAKATSTKKFKGEDAFVDENDSKEAESGKNPQKADLIDRKIRALNPEPGVWTTQEGKRVKLLEAEINENELVLKKIQVEGEKPRRVESSM